MSIINLLTNNQADMDDYFLSFLPYGQCLHPEEQQYPLLR